MYLNGSGVLLSKGDDVIVGQMDMTINYMGSPIDLTNNALGEWRVLLDGVLSSKELVIDASITFSSDAIYQQVLTDSLSGTADYYKITYPNGKFFTAYLTPTGLTYQASKDTAVTTSLKFISSQEVFLNGEPANALVTTLYPIQLFEDGAIVGQVSINYINELTVIFETPIVSGSLGIEEITVETLTIEYTETENEITGSISISEITQEEILVQYSETENEITGTMSVLSIDQVEVLVPADNVENEITGSISIEEITKA